MTSRLSFQRTETWKTSRDPDYQGKKARVEHLYAIADGDVVPEPGEPVVVFSMDDFGPLNLQPHPAGNGPNAVDGDVTLTGIRGRVGERPTPARTGCGTCSPPSNWAATRCTGT